MTSETILGPLEDEIKQTRVRIEQWSENLKAATQNNECALDAVERLDQEEIERLEEEMTVVQTKSTVLQAQIKKENDQENKLRAELLAMQKVEQTLPHEVKEALAQKTLAEKSYNGKLEDIASQNQSCASQMNELTAQIVAFKRLGLDFERTEKNGVDGLRLVFTLIDEKSPERKFSFKVVVNDDSKYEVSDVSVPCPNMAEYLGKLNVTNNFSAFVKSMRAHFKRYVESTAAA